MKTSNCCDAQLLPESDVCSKCLEHSEPTDWYDKQHELYKKLDKIDNAHSVLSTLAWYEKLARNLIDCAEDIEQLKLIEHFVDKKLEEIENE